MNRKEKDYWVAFSAFSPIGPKRFQLLRKYFGSAKKAWEAKREELLKIGLKEKLVSEFIKFRLDFNLPSYFLRLEKLGVKIITIEDKNYPENLKNIDGAPFLLYIIGQILPADSLAIGVVGTRKITSYGREVTEKLVADLAVSELTIVSGLAYGVDSIAHNSALQSGGRTIGVWAGGLDTVTSGFRQSIIEKILKSNSGAIISEFPLGFHPSRVTFPQRNRIIAGLSLGVLVTEAAGDSGAIITANFAKKQDRPVFAVPGPITSSLSKGTADLIKKGAKLVYSVGDILGELKIEKRREGERARRVLPENKEEEVILNLLKDETKQIDEIIRETRLGTGKVISLLTMMEIKGKIKNLGGGTYGVSR